MNEEIFMHEYFYPMKLANFEFALKDFKDSASLMSEKNVFKKFLDFSKEIQPQKKRYIPL